MSIIARNPNGTLVRKPNGKLSQGGSCGGGTCGTGCGDCCYSTDAEFNVTIPSIKSIDMFGNQIQWGRSAKISAESWYSDGSVFEVIFGYPTPIPAKIRTRVYCANGFLVTDQTMLIFNEEIWQEYDQYDCSFLAVPISAGDCFSSTEEGYWRFWSTLGSSWEGLYGSATITVTNNHCCRDSSGNCVSGTPDADGYCFDPEAP